MSGTGKTTLFLNLLKHWKSAQGQPAKHKFIFDHEGEFADRMKVKPATRLNQLGQGNITCFDPCDLYPGDTEKAFQFYCDFIFQYSDRFKGPFVLASDELQKFTDTSQNGIPHEFKIVLETGRRYEIDFLGIGQSANLVHTRLRNQATELYCFMQGDDRATAFAENLGVTEAKLLKPGEYVCLNRQTGKKTKGKVF